jgi:polyisoprenoid-binding protein YceI
MKKIKTIKSLIVAAIVGVIALSSFNSGDDKLVSKNGHINFFSHTAVEDISADNYTVVSTLTPSTGDVVFSVAMQSFEFEKAMMQKHFNSDKFLDTKTYPKAKLVGKITNLSQINFAKDGTYDATVEGDLTMHGETKHIKETGKITVSGSKITVDTKMNIVLADYKIAFEDGKPSTNIAKEVKATIKAEYNK